MRIPEAGQRRKAVLAILRTLSIFLTEVPNEVFKQSWKNSTVLCNCGISFGSFLTVNKFLFFFFVCTYCVSPGFSGGSAGKESTCDVEDLGSIPELGGSHGGGHENPLQYSCLENPHGRGAWQATVPWGRKVGHD